ncbi:hypothetical protein E4T52_10878 [Aureobasidium sp. EXF-3400]|nr:hypothetical protein E4T51_09528 [Aureobasidium sp. EXF-12344]KAI4774139.1 hypothetical protein E4T52_10878 [Aureobasidium sp. EXF-3400]
MTASTVATPEPLWVFEKAVLAHAPEFDVACAARLRIAHDQNDDQGSISVRLNADLADFGKQTLMLVIRPDMVDTCIVVAKSNDKLIPDRMFPMVPVSVTNSAAVSTLILCLKATGVVLVPPSVDGATLRPGSRGPNLEAFARICQSKTIHLHLSKQQFKDGDLHHLRTFSGALRARMLKAQALDYKRLNAGQGAIEKDWRVFGQSANPPPYCEPASTRSVLGKRPRDDSPSEALPTSATPCSPPPPWSPTETNTPTTCSPSPAQIFPTKFTNDTKSSYRQRIKVLDLQRQLKGVPDDLLREVLAGSGHQHLLAPAPSLGLKTLSKGTNSLIERLSPLRASAATEDAAMVARIDKIIEKRLDKLTKDAFKSLAQRRLHALVESQLPLAAELFLNGAVADHRDQFYEDCKTNEVTVHEHIDEGITEIRDVTNECTKELSDMAQQCMDSLDEHSKKLDASAEQELEKMKRWFGELAKGFFEKKTDVGFASVTTRTRRISM